MALIKPFQGYHYNYNLLKDKNSLFVPPYDVISKSELKAFRKTNPHNYIHITLAEPKGEKDPYSSVRKKLQQWIKSQILVRDETPSLYFYTMEYDSNPDLQLSTSTRKSRNILSGFISLVKLESYETGKVIPHEVTFAAPRTDRMNLLASAQAHLEPVYCLYEDKKGLVQDAFEKKIQRQKPLIMVKDSKSTIHRFWKLDQPELLAKVTQLMAKKSLLIADGHHRYGAALQYREHLLSTGQQLPEDHPSDYIMMFLANMDDKELFIAPTHRMYKHIPEKIHASLLEQMSRDFKVYASPETSKAKSQQWFLNKLSKFPPRKPVFGLYNGQFYLLEYQAPLAGPLILDTEILQENVLQKILQLNDSTQVFKHLGFSHSLKETIQQVDRQTFQGAFILRAPDIHDVKKICSSNRMMPQKSTYFFPKPLSGLVLSVF